MNMFLIPNMIDLYLFSSRNWLCTRSFHYIDQECYPLWSLGLHHSFHKTNYKHNLRPNRGFWKWTIPSYSHLNRNNLIYHQIIHVDQKQLKEDVKPSQQDVSPGTVKTCIAGSHVQLTKPSIAGLRHNVKHQ